MVEKVRVNSFECLSKCGITEYQPFCTLSFSPCMDMENSNFLLCITVMFKIYGMTNSDFLHFYGYSLVPDFP